MQAAVVAHTSSKLACNAVQASLPRQHKLIYREPVSLKSNNDSRKEEELLMQAPSSQHCLAEQTLNAALANFVEQNPGSALHTGLETTLMQLLDKGFMMTKSERKAVLLKVLREYANPLPLKQQSITPKTLIEAVKQSGAVYLNGATWSFGLKKDLPKRLPYGRYRGITLKNDTCTAIGSISWEDQDCKFYDTILSRQWLCECLMQSESESAIYWCWEFCKTFVSKATLLGKDTALAQMERQTTFIKVWSSNQLTHPKITLVEFWEELEHSWRLPLQRWRENQFHLVSGASRENHGLQNMQDSYTAGKGMELLRQAIEHWAPRPHVVKYLVRKECTDIVKGTKQAGKRKASAMNGFLPSHSHFPDAAASVSQLDEQPESSTMPSSANSDLNAEAYAAPLAACSAGQQGSTEQVSFVEVSVNGQVCSIHPRDAVQCRAAAVPHQMPGVPMTVHDLQQSSDVTASANVFLDTGYLDFLTDLTDLEPWDHVNSGSLRLNVRLAKMAEPAQQSRAIHQLLTSIITKCGMECAFAMTVKVPGSTLSCTKSAGISPVQIKEANGLCPVISAVYFSHTEPDQMILEGCLSEACTLWSFNDITRAVTYLQVVKTAAKNDNAETALKNDDAETVLKNKDAETALKKEAAETAVKKEVAETAVNKEVAETAVKKEVVETAVKKEVAETAAVSLSNASPGTRGGGSVRSGSHQKQEDKEAEAVSIRTRAQTRAQASRAVMQGHQRKRAETGQTPSGALQRKRAKTGQTVEGDIAMQSAPHAAGTDVPTVSTAAAIATDVAPQHPLADSSSEATEAVQGVSRVPGHGVLQQIPRLHDIEHLLLSARQSPEETIAAVHHSMITVQMPRGVLDSGSFWLQAQCGSCISEPFAMPRYAVTVKEESVSRFQEHWRRYMYPPDTLRRVQWTGDPVIARAQRSSPSPHSELGSAAAQTSTHVNKEHKDGRGGTSALQLLHACKLGNYKVAEHLARLAAVVTMKSYKSDASRNVMMERDSEGVSCLHAIAQSPCLDPKDTNLMVSDILWTAGGAELIHDRTRWGLHAMHYAAGNLGQGCPVLNEMIKLSSHQDFGGILECKDARGCTPLHWAAKVGNANAITLLLNAGADPNAQDHAQASPLHYAAVSPTAYRLKCITAMLAVPVQTQADVTAKDINGQTPMHWLAGACHLSAHLEAMKLLMESGADVCAADSLGNSPLHNAAASSSLPATASLLLAHGADAQAVNVYGDTALHTAAGFGNIALLECLTEETQKRDSLAAALSCTNKAGYTPLQLAVLVGWSKAAVCFLLQLDLQQHQKKVSGQLLELLVAQGWRSEMGPLLLRQTLAEGVSVPALGRSLQLLSKQRLKEPHDITGEPVQSASRFRSQLHLRFSNTVSGPNRLLRVRMVGLFRIASSAGGREKAVPNAVDFVFPRRPAGLDPRPQSSFISSESQSVLSVFNRFYDLPGYMPSYNQPVKAVDDVLSGLVDSCNSQSDHFLGSLALFHGPFTDHYWLLDGHQKLATLQLILAFGMHWAKSQGASQAALFDALRSCLWAEKAEEAPSRWRLQHRHDDQEFLCANVLQSFLPVSYTWQAEAADKFQSDGRTTAGGVVSDHSAGCQDSWADHPQGLSNAAWWHVYANAHRVQQVLTDEQRMHQLDLAAFFRHMCQRCHLACTIFRDEGSAFTVLGSLQLETPVMDRIRTGLLPLLLAHQEPFAERWNLWEVEFGSSLFEELFIHCKQIMQPADTGSKLSVLEFYLNTVTHDRPNDISKAAAVKSCLTQLFHCAAILLHKVTSYGFAAATTSVAQPAIKQEEMAQADTVTDMDAEMQKLPVLDRPAVVEKQPGNTAAGVSVMEEAGCSDKEEAKGHHSTEVETLQSLDDLCRFLMLMPDREWIDLALHFCHLEQDPSQRLAFFGCLEALQVFLWLTEATADSKESRWNCIREKLQHKVCQSQDQMQQSQQQQQQQQQQEQEQEQGGTPVPGLGLQAGLAQQPAAAGPSMPTPAHLGLQAAKLTDTEKTRFKAELSRSDFLRQGNKDLVKYLLLRAEDTLLWASISWSQLQVDQILPDQPYARSSGTLWQQAVLDRPSPTDPECARQHWTASQMQSARRSIGNMLLLQAATSFTDRQRKQEFSDKKDYVCKFKSGLFPMSAAILDEPFFSCKYEYADRQQAYLMRLCQVYGL